MNVLVRKVVVGKEKYMIYRDLLLRSVCARTKIFVKARKGIQGKINIHNYTERNPEILLHGRA